ncbi:hypothetical protein WP2S18C03_13410 [Aeromonas veronii]|nr:hypothetical protein WP2S18C03_13410 [Aeromonas veronii]
MFHLRKNQGWATSRGQKVGVGSTRPIHSQVMGRNKKGYEVMPGFQPIVGKPLSIPSMFFLFPESASSRGFLYDGGKAAQQR